jgi:hypothetical protein
MEDTTGWGDLVIFEEVAVNEHVARKGVNKKRTKNVDVGTCGITIRRSKNNKHTCISCNMHGTLILPCADISWSNTQKTDEKYT